MVWLRRLLILILALVPLLAGALYLALRGSLPQLEGKRQAGVATPVELARDAQGYLSITAGNRIDAARALGFVHAQERFFQMDLLRRNAAGELSALVGAKALALDQSRRIHRFRARTERALAALPPEHRQLLEAYTAGVNEGLAGLSVRPFEYGLLRQAPAPWRAQDSLLAVLSMYLDLQAAQGRDELATGALKEALPAEWFAFLTQHSADWQAAIDGSQVQALPVPDTPWPEKLRATAKLACSDCGLTDSRDIGSNNFAVGGALSPHGGAILADDMHLGIRVPNTWFKAQLRWPGKDGRQLTVSGLSLPGTPAIVVGSNGRVAWGFTNSTADWSDVIALKLSADGLRYQSPAGEKPLQIHRERIEIAGAPAVEYEVRETEWGPVMAKPFERYALRWVAHDAEALNLRALALEQAASVDEALTIAAGAGMPAQNILAADASGAIGWSIAGAIPRRQLLDMDTPQDWSEGRNRWSGYLAAGDAAWPKVVNPADARLWSANARIVGGAALALIGNGGYDLGARGQQIRDGLRAKDKLDEAALHAVQLDDRAIFLQRWRKLLLDEVLTPDFVARNQLADYRRQIEQGAAAARVDDVGYSWVRAFRERSLEQMFKPLAALLEARQLKLRDLKWVPETPAWALISARRSDVLDGSWRALFEQAVLDSRAELLKKAAGKPEGVQWGQQNLSSFQHPLSAALPPWLARYLDLPATPMNGDRHMPRVQLSVHGQSERMVVAPGHEAQGILTMPGGQSGHPLSPFYRADHGAWLAGAPQPFLPGAAQYRLVLQP
ncbi:penicillin acylase family protein [Roseateles violae]|uniref:Penicillin acylase family protein n=1 Tax=Roseateles violae TaxID=3058042 RepID=A0ABT8DSS8_9BURK|nr:penicillin acylase family protein [Pelomonas sp. PFR6]MDN3920113.1 penicillin acylase family protein [Pelomonas sp. PFR6]